MVEGSPGESLQVYIKYLPQDAVDKNLIYPWMVLRHPGLCLVICHLQEVGIHFTVTLSLAAEAELVIATISAYCCKIHETGKWNYKHIYTTCNTDYSVD